MSTFSLLVIGCGDLGGAVAAHCAAAGWRVWGCAPRAIALPSVEAIAADVTDPASLQVLATIAPTHVLIALSPGAFTDERYRSVYVDGLANCLQHIDRTQLRRLLWVSSTSVYHQDDGSEVDETTPANPTTFSGRRLLEAEALLATAQLPYTVIRFGGIYGPGRDRLLRQLRGGTCSPAEPLRYSNRIHRDDAVGVLEFLLAQEVAGAALQNLYLGVDTEPAPIAQVERWFCAFLDLGYSALRLHGEEQRGGNRRCSSRRLQALGYRFRYPSYREGLPTLVAA